MRRQRKIRGAALAAMPAIGRQRRPLIRTRARECSKLQFNRVGRALRGIRKRLVDRACRSAPADLHLVAAPQGLLLDKSWREGFACRGAARSVVDAWIPTILGDLVDLRAAFPTPKIVLTTRRRARDRPPTAGQRDGGLRRGERAYPRAAACANVRVSWAGLACARRLRFRRASSSPPSSDRSRRGVAALHRDLIAAFAFPERSISRATSPVDKGMCGLAVMWERLPNASPPAAPTDENAALCAANRPAL